MAFTFTVTDSAPVGNLRKVWGTFTSASGDSSGSLGPSVHGLNHLADYNVSLDAGGLNADNPKIAISGGTATLTFNDTLGYSGRWSVLGR